MIKVTIRDNRWGTILVHYKGMNLNCLIPYTVEGDYSERLANNFCEIVGDKKYEIKFELTHYPFEEIRIRNSIEQRFTKKQFK